MAAGSQIIYTVTFPAGYRRSDGCLLDRAVTVRQSAKAVRLGLLELLHFMRLAPANAEFRADAAVVLDRLNGMAGEW